MGLDQYLTKRTYIGGNFEHNKISGTVNLKKDGKKIPIDIKRITYIDEQVGYWRKANQIHRWFVENVQDGKDDCGDYCVSEEQLRELLALCHKVKEVAKLKKGAVTNGKRLEGGVWVPIVEEGKEIVNEEEVAEILPTASGFFFGSTDYDEYYMQDIDDTIEIIEGVLKEIPEPGKMRFDIQYSSSW